MTTICLTGLLICSTEEADANKELTSIAFDYLHTPYKYGGTTPKGFDCSGYVQFVFQQLQIELPRTSREQATVGITVAYNDLQVGDIVYFKANAKGPVTHSGIYIGDNQFISSTSSSGVRIDDLTKSKYWSKRYAGARRILPPPTPIVTNTSVFTDIPTTDSMYSTYQKINELGILRSIEGDFLPTNAITRAEMANVLSKLVTTSTPSTQAILLHDLPIDFWAKPAIEFVLTNQYMYPYSDGTFRPNQVLTRRQGYELLVKAWPSNKVGAFYNFYHTYDTNPENPLTREEFVHLFNDLYFE